MFWKKADVLFEELHRVDFFREITKETCKAIQPFTSYVSLYSGEVLFNQGEDADSLYIVVEGELGIFFDTDSGVRLGKGEVIGELGVFLNETRQATVKAVQHSKVIKIFAEGFQLAIQSHYEIGEKIEALVFNRLKENELIRYMEDIFGKADKRALVRYRDKLSLTKLKRGEVLFEEGDPSDSFYLVIHGKLRISKSFGNGKDSLIGTVNTGETVGEIGLVTGNNRDAKAVAERFSLLIQVPKEFFVQILKDFPDASLALLKSVIERDYEKDKTLKFEGHSKIFGVIPISEGIVIERVVSGISKALRTLGYKTSIVDREKFQTTIPLNGDQNAYSERLQRIKIDYWIYELEKANDFIFFICEESLSEWNQLCLNYSEEIILLADADASSNPTEIEKNYHYFQEFRQDLVNLVLLHFKEKKLPSGTRFWLEPRHIGFHYHVRWNKRGEELERIARMISHNGLGFVLSGGGARGYAHLALITALQEEGVRLDVVGGCSAGSFCAALIGLNLSAEEILKLTRAIASKVKLDYTLPYLSIFAGKSYQQFVHEIFGEVRIEDLWIPYFAVASNMTQVRKEVFKRGPVAEATIASSSIPGLLPPVITEEGDVLVDGGVLDNLPFREMRKHLKGGVVVASDIAVEDKCAQYRGVKTYRSGFQLLFTKLKKILKKIFLRKEEIQEPPSIFTILMHASSLASIYMQQKRAPLNIDFYIKFPLMDYNVVTFNKTIEKEIYQRSYELSKDFIIKMKRDPKLQKNFPEKNSN